MYVHKPYNEEKVLSELSKGSEEAFAQLFNHYRGQIYGVAIKFLKSRELAEEVVQDVFLKVWVRRDKFSAIQNFKGYLFTIARNHVFDSLKKIAQESKAKTEMALVHTEDASDNSLPDNHYRELLQEAVNQLTPQQKQVFQLAKVEGLSHQTVSEQLQISPLTVKTHMAKALQRIRHNLAHRISLFSLSAILAAVSQLF